VVLSSTGLFYVERKRLADLALRHRLPTMCEGREWAAAGCLMSYAPSFSDLVRRTATYVDISKYVGPVKSFQLAV
jgi:putative ABC transport system substrate-binding protein